MKAPLLTVDDLVVLYHAAERQVTAVDHVSFQLGAGRTLGIVGESGSGKSTIGLSLLHLLPRSAEVRGSIVVDGIGVHDADERTINTLRGATVGLVYQDALAALNPVRTVGSQIAEVMRFHLRLSRRGAKAATLEALAAVGIGDVETRFGQFPHEFSGGMRQRAAIAMALAARPRLLIADEPTTALDVTVKAQILALLRDLKARLGMAMIVISHDLEVIRETADDVAVMYHGRIVEIGAAASVLARPRHPYTRDLIRSAPSVEAPVISFIPGTPPAPGAIFAGCAFEPRCSVGRGNPKCCTVSPPLRPAPLPTLVACHFPLTDADAATAGERSLPPR
jgi:oligopeptide/dipeptide ABC transporter ATP-binding protein